eukprot:14655481-Alexandrium_andersonii.AAC.1
MLMPWACFAACAVGFVKIPADNGMLSHVQYSRELFAQRTREALVWAGTRDMATDGATKGAAGRELLHLAAQCCSRIQHELK